MSDKLKLIPSADESLLLDGHTLPAGLTCGSGKATGMNLLISSPAAFPAKTSASQESEPDLQANGAASSRKSSALRQRSRRGGVSSRMFQGSLALAAGEILPSSSQGYGNAGLLSATGFWTANISESPNEGVAVSLSAVLQRQVSERYFLSPKAARGILRRAEKRGRKLPPPLEAALTVLASTHQDEAARTT